MTKNELLPLGSVKRCPACGYNPKSYPLADKFRAVFVRRETRAGNTIVEDRSFVKRICPLCMYDWKEMPLYQEEAQNDST